MPEINSLTRCKPVNVQIDLGDGDTVTVQFDRNRVTPAWIGAASARDDAQDVLSLPKALADVILHWDVTSDGEPFPALADNIAVLSFPAQQTLLKKILEAAVPGEAEGKASSGPSSSASSASVAPPETSPNGLGTSPSLELSASQSPT